MQSKIHTHISHIPATLCTLQESVSQAVQAVRACDPGGVHGEVAQHMGDALALQVGQQRAFAGGPGQ